MFTRRRRPSPGPPRAVPTARDSPLSLLHKTVEPRRVICVPFSVFDVFTDRFCRTVLMDWRRAFVRQREVKIMSIDLVKEHMISNNEGTLSALLYRHLFFFAPYMLREPIWREVLMREIRYVIVNRWGVQSRRLLRIIFLSRMFFLFEFFQKWQEGILDVNDEKLRYSMAGQGYQDFYSAVRIEAGLLAYQNYLTAHCNFPQENCFSAIAKSVVYTLEDVMGNPQLSDNRFEKFSQLPELCQDLILEKLDRGTLLNCRIAGRVLQRNVDRILIYKMRPPFDTCKLDEATFDELKKEVRLNISAPLRRHYPLRDAVIKYDRLSHALRLMNVEHVEHYLSPYVLKLFKVCQFRSLTVRANDYHQDIFTALLHDLCYLEVIRVTFSSFTDSKIDTLKKNVDNAGFDMVIFCEDPLVICLQRLPAVTDLGPSPKKRRRLFELS